MKFCFVVEVAGPCRRLAFEKAGRLRRVMFLWFSLSVFPYSWTEFLQLYRRAAQRMKDEAAQGPQ